MSVKQTVRRTRLDIQKYVNKVCQTHADEDEYHHRKLHTML